MRLGNVSMLLDDHEGAIAGYLHAMNDPRFRRDARVSLAMVHYIGGFLDLAVQQLRGLPVNDSIRSNLHDFAKAYEEKRDLYGARDVYRMILAAAPLDSEARRKLDAVMAQLEPPAHRAAPHDKPPVIHPQAPPPRVPTMKPAEAEALSLRMGMLSNTAGTDITSYSAPKVFRTADGVLVPKGTAKTGQVTPVDPVNETNVRLARIEAGGCRPSPDLMAALQRLEARVAKHPASRVLAFWWNFWLVILA